MELTLLGTGTCSPVPERTPACYFLKAGARRFLIDPGPGAVNRLAQAGIDPFSVDAIFISHMHPDHCADLVPWLFSYKHCLGDQLRGDIDIIAPEGFKEFFDNLMIANGQWVLSDNYEIKIEEVRDTRWSQGGVSIISSPVLHGAGGLGYRFERDGKSLAYSGDTGYCEELIELARDADALLVECSVPDDHDVNGHMRPGEVAQTGIRSGVRRLVLTHFYPVVDTDKVADIVRGAGYQGEITVGEDGMTIEL